jgi:hypothetical protein
MSPRFFTAAFGAILAASVLALAFAAHRGEIGAAYIAPIILFEALSLIFLFLFLQDMASAPFVALESRWGGLGGGLGGWRMPRSIVYLLCTLVFAVLFATAAEHAVDRAASQNAPAKQSEAPRRVDAAKQRETAKGSEAQKGDAARPPDAAKK